ncbi:hypothetical protein AALO_G00050630, partial [Alosa alosa]
MDIVSAAIPDRECEVPWVALAGPGQEAAVDPPCQEQLLSLYPSDVGVEPPVNGYHTQSTGELTLSGTVTEVCPPVITQKHTHTVDTHTHTHTPSHTLPLSLSISLFLSHTHTHTNTHTHTH